MTLFEQAFCEHFAEHQNTAAAYRHALDLHMRPGLAIDETELQQRGYRLRQRQDIAQHIMNIEARVGAALDDGGQLIKRLTREFVQMAFADPGEMFDAQGAMLPIHQMSEAARSMIASIEVETIRALDGTEIGGVTKIKRWDKVKVMDSIARVMGIYQDKLQLNIDMSWVNELEQARQRALGAPDAAPMVDITPVKEWADLC